MPFIEKESNMNIAESVNDLFHTIEDEEIIDEVKEEFVPFENNRNKLIQSDSVDSFLSQYDVMCKEGDAVLACFDFENAQDLKNYINEKEITFDELKKEVVQASLLALEVIIFESDSDY